MDRPLDELYLHWLYSQVVDPEVKNPNRTYWGLLKKLFTKEFIWFVPNDDNRIEDGKDLRFEFVDDAELEDVDIAWVHLGCSMLELLIGLSRRIAFELESSPRDWFWHLLGNLNLQTLNDKRGFPDAYVDSILDTVIYRTYGPDGFGGIFPLKYAQEDQRKVELWYQLNAYVNEIIDAKGG
jgi:hypothetical protein